jgi:hypothetical protein
MAVNRAKGERVSTRTFNADYKRGIRKANKGKQGSAEYSVLRLINTLQHAKTLKANGSTRFGKVMQAEQDVKSAALTARLRVLYFAFAALRKGGTQ